MFSVQNLCICGVYFLTLERWIKKISSFRINAKIETSSSHSESSRPSTMVSDIESKHPEWGPSQSAAVMTEKTVDGLETTTVDNFRDVLSITEAYETIIFDLGGVILNWDSIHTTSMPEGVNDLKKLLDHPIWRDLEQGSISRNLALTLLSVELQTPYDKLKEILDLSVASLRANQAMVALLKALHQKNKKYSVCQILIRSHFQSSMKSVNFGSTSIAFIHLPCCKTESQIVALLNMSFLIHLYVLRALSSWTIKWRT